VQNNIAQPNTSSATPHRKSFREADGVPRETVTSGLLDPSSAAHSKLGVARLIPGSIPRNFRADYKASSALTAGKFHTTMHFVRNEPRQKIPALVYDFQFQDRAPRRVQSRQSFLPSSPWAFPATATETATATQPSVSEEEVS
jgi:hypothetical protein